MSETAAEYDLGNLLDDVTAPLVVLSFPHIREVVLRAIIATGVMVDVSIRRVRDSPGDPGCFEWRAEQIDPLRHWALRTWNPAGEFWEVPTWSESHRGYLDPVDAYDAAIAHIEAALDVVGPRP